MSFLTKKCLEFFLNNDRTIFARWWIFTFKLGHTHWQSILRIIAFLFVNTRFIQIIVRKYLIIFVAILAAFGWFLINFFIVNLFIDQNTFPFQCTGFTDFIFQRRRLFVVWLMSIIHHRSNHNIVGLATVSNHFFYEYFYCFFVILLFLRFRKLLHFCYLRLNAIFILRN